MKLTIKPVMAIFDIAIFIKSYLKSKYRYNMKERKRNNVGN